MLTLPYLALQVKVDLVQIDVICAQQLQAGFTGDADIPLRKVGLSPLLNPYLGGDQDFLAEGVERLSQDLLAITISLGCVEEIYSQLISPAKHLLEGALVQRAIHTRQCVTTDSNFRECEVLMSSILHGRLIIYAKGRVETPFTMACWPAWPI
jgi:hypothetical protein